MTGVIASIAIRAASTMMSKQSPGVAGASTGSGDSPWRPKIAMSRSACSGLVGMPVDGPGALHVDDDERQLGGERQPERLRLQREARARPRR